MRHGSLIIKHHNTVLIDKKPGGYATQGKLRLKSGLRFKTEIDYSLCKALNILPTPYFY
jgi:hypothetical protein